MEVETRLFLVRHAEVEARYHRIFGGRIDMDLSPLGYTQAGKTADYLKRFNFNRIYASPMKRVQQTVKAISEHSPAPIEILEGLREVHFGAWTGLGWQEVFDRYQLSAYEWLRAIDHGLIPDAETGNEFHARVDACLTQILRESRGHDVAVVCHGGVIRMLLAILLGLPLPKTAGFEIDYASITVVEYRQRKTETTLLNFTPWRDYP